MTRYRGSIKPPKPDCKSHQRKLLFRGKRSRRRRRRGRLVGPPGLGDRPGFTGVVATAAAAGCLADNDHYDSRAFSGDSEIRVTSIASAGESSSSSSSTSSRCGAGSACGIGEKGARESAILTDSRRSFAVSLNKLCYIDPIGDLYCHPRGAKVDEKGLMKNQR